MSKKTKFRAIYAAIGVHGSPVFEVLWDEISFFNSLLNFLRPHLATPALYCCFIQVFFSSMKAVVSQLYEDGGRPLARHRAVTLQPSHTGNFTLSEEHDRDLRRSVRSAYLRDQATGVEVLPRLRDAVVLWVGDDAWTVTGFETDPLTRKAVAQSWYVSLSLLGLTGSVCETRRTK